MNFCISVFTEINPLLIKHIVKGNGNKKIYCYLKETLKQYIEVYYGISYLPYFVRYLIRILSCPPSWIFVDMHDAYQVGSRNFICLRKMINIRA